MKSIEVLIDFSMEKVVCSSIEGVQKGDFVILNVDGILFSGQAISNPFTVDSKYKIVRKVDENDLKAIQKNKLDSKNCLKEANKMKDRLNLSMNFIDSYYTFDRKQLFFLFVADNRVDFRELARKLADKYRTRIELRQIGIRDKAKRVGGLGPCGLFLCCNSFLTDFNSVSINMAKNQFLALNPSKINGVCGRLLCCLNYEDETYRKLREHAPKVSSLYDTPKGKGKIVSVDIFKKTCSVELKDKSIMVADYSKDYESNK